MAQDVRSLSGRISDTSANNPNFIMVEADYTSSSWTSAHSIVFRVSGHVRMRMWAIISEEFVVNADTPVVGIGFSSDDESTFYIGGGVSYYLLDGMLTWGGLPRSGSTIHHALTAYDPNTGSPTALQDILVMNDHIRTKMYGGTLTAGKIKWCCVWEPILPGSTVVAGSGGSL